MVVKVKEYFEKTRQIQTHIIVCILWCFYSYTCISNDYQWLCKYSYNCKYVSSIITNLIVNIYILKIMTNLKNTFYVEKEIQDVMKEIL